MKNAHAPRVDKIHCKILLKTELNGAENAVVVDLSGNGVFVSLEDQFGCASHIMNPLKCADQQSEAPVEESLDDQIRG